MNFGELKTLVRKITGDRLASNQVMDQDVFLGVAFNDVIIPEMNGRHDWFFKESMVTTLVPAATYVIQMPSNLENVGVLILHTGAIGTTRPLTHMPQRAFFEQFTDPSLESASFPAYYTWVNREIWFDRPTSAQWNVRIIGYTRFPRLVEDSDVPTWLDDSRHILLAYGVAGFCYQTFEDSKNSQVWFNIYEQGVTQYWNVTEGKRDANSKLGQYAADNIPSPGAYWANPFIIKDPR